MCEFEVFGLRRRLWHLYLASFNNTININVNNKNLTGYHMDVMHEVQLAQECLNYHLSETDFSDQWFKMASS